MVGTLDVRVRGNTIVPSTFLGRFSILCAILRQLHLVLQISLLTSELVQFRPDVFFVDQLSACVPLLRLRHRKVPVLFYCHFPDKLLAHREGLAKKLYRVPFDWFESWSTGCCNTIVVNSNFTKGIFDDAFPSLRSRNPEVVYPCVNTNDADTSNTPQIGDPGPLWRGKKVFLSINRFERKKDVGLVIRAYARLTAATRQSTRLIIAGGYDTRVTENVNYHKELEALCKSCELATATAKNLVSALAIPEDIDVLFLLSVPTTLKDTLLQTSSLLVYTPKFEHFGIVPLEAMLSRLPVLAAKTGGPKETIVDGQTGWLRNHDEVDKWTEVMNGIVSQLTSEQLRAIGARGRERVIKHFSQDSMALRLNGVIQGTKVEDGSNVEREVCFALAGLSALGALVLGILMAIFRVL